MKGDLKSLSFIQALRGLAVLWVVLFHMLSIEEKYSGGDFILPNFLRLGQTGVDLFFVISGFVMVMISKERFLLKGETMRFLWGRGARIYPVYWIYFILVTAIFLVKPSWVNASQGHQIDLVKSFFLLPSNQLPIVMVAWSLIHELWFYLIFALLLNFNKRLLLPTLVLWAVIVIFGNLILKNSDLSAYTKIAFHPYTLEFIIGAIVAIFVYSKHSVKVPQKTIMAILAAVPVGLVIAHKNNVVIDTGLIRFFTFGMLFGLLVLSLAMLEIRKKIYFPKSLVFIGDISYTVYLSHILILSAVGRIWFMAGPNSTKLYDNFLVLLIMLIVVFLYGWFGYRYTEQPILSLSHRLRNRWFGV